MVVMALGSAGCDRSLRWMSVVVAPTLMVESVAAMFGGESKPASEVGQG